MGQPTIDARMKRCYILMTGDPDMLVRFQALTPQNWHCVVVTDLDELGSWNDILLHRFLVMDLDESDVFDPLDVIRILRREHQINTPVFCFGGDEDIQDEMRLARADRFFSREEMLEMLPRFFEQYRWGE